MDLGQSYFTNFTNVLSKHSKTRLVCQASMFRNSVHPVIMRPLFAHLQKKQKTKKTKYLRKKEFKCLWNSSFIHACHLESWVKWYLGMSQWSIIHIYTEDVNVTFLLVPSLRQCASVAGSGLWRRPGALGGWVAGGEYKVGIWYLVLITLYTGAECGDRDWGLSDSDVAQCTTG